MWISPPFAQTAENSGFRVVLTLIASVMSAYAQNPPPLSLEQWWKPPPEQENGEGMKSHILKKSQILKTLMGFAKRCKRQSDAFNTPFKVSLNLYSPTLMAQPLSTASFPALKKKLQLEFHKWMRQHLTMSASTPKSLLAFQHAPGIFGSFATGGHSEPDPWVQPLQNHPQHKELKEYLLCHLYFLLWQLEKGKCSAGKSKKWGRSSWCPSC